MADVKTLKRFALKVAGALVPFPYQPPEGVLFPCGHAVADVAPLHVKHLCPVPQPAKFQSDLDALCRGLRSLQLPELERLSPERHRKTSPRSFLLSFDDGLRESYEVIAPMLSRQGVPAIFFVNSATIDNKQLMWRHKIGLLIERSRELPGYAPPQLDLRPNERLEDRLRALKSRDESLIDEIAKSIGVDFEGYLRTTRPYLDRDEVLSLSRAGFAVGAHSATHRYFQEMSVKDQKREISTCVEFIRSLGVPCRYFAFPFHDEGVSLAVFDHIRDLGISLSFGTSEAKVDSVTFSYQRFSIEALDSTVPQVLRHLSVKSFLRQASGTEFMRRNA